jgi:TM2 domain-containing membrane protein YozV
MLSLNMEGENQQPTVAPITPPVVPPSGPPVVPPDPAPSSGANESHRSFVVAWLLSYFLGSFGIDRFYRGFIGTGVLKLITAGGLGVWSAIDWLMTGFGHPKDKKGLILKGFSKNRKVVQILTAVILGLSFFIIPGVILLLSFLAVPALQQNARNIERTADVKAIAAGISLYESNSSGKLPASIAEGPSIKDLDICGTSCTSGSSTGKLSFFSAANIQFHGYKDNLTVPNDSTVYIVEDATCNSVTNALQSVSGNQNSVAILYSTESPPHGIKQQCQPV